MKFVKRPIVVEAYQTQHGEIIHTNEGDMIADPNDWIITGVLGERYPCKPDIFDLTYDRYGLLNRLFRVIRMIGWFVLGSVAGAFWILIISWLIIAFGSSLGITR